MNETSMSKLWRVYLEKAAVGDIKSLGQLGLIELTRKTGIDLGLLDTRAPDETGPVVKRLLEMAATLPETTKDERKDMDRFTLRGQEKEIFKLGIVFLNAAYDGKADRVQELIDADYPVNFQHPRFLTTALHQAAERSHRDVVRTLVNSGQCDYLLQDFRGRLAYNCAELFGRDPGVERLLLVKTRQQARHDGVDLFKQQMELLEQWSHQRWFNALAEFDRFPNWKNRHHKIGSPSLKR